MLEEEQICYLLTILLAQLLCARVTLFITTFSVRTH